MNKTELVEILAAKVGLTKKATQEVVDGCFEEMAKELKAGKEVKIYGFGNFQVKKTKARTGVNPLTKKPISIPAGKKVSFHLAESVKQEL